MNWILIIKLVNTDVPDALLEKKYALSSCLAGCSFVCVVQIIGWLL